jgi:hypothetical protein
MPNLLTNPQDFKRKCDDVGVTYDLLIEAQECLGKQACSKFFKGKSKRGGGSTTSSSMVDDWVYTLKYAIDNPSEQDKDTYVPRTVEPLDEWKDFVTLVNTPIEEDIYNSWKNLTPKKIGQEVRKYGLTFGTANSNAIKTLQERSMAMVERRIKNFWNKTIEFNQETKQELDYNALNIFQLREISKDVGCTIYQQNKEQLISNIKKRKQDLKSYSKDEKEEYSNISLLTLKIIARNKGLTQYNNLKKEDLVKLLTEFDKIDEEKDKITLGNVEVISRQSDGYINASQLCKAGKKYYNDWFRLEKTKEFLTELSQELKIDILTDKTDPGGKSRHENTNVSLIKINQYNDSDQSTWVHPRVAIHIAQWISPKFAVNVTGWIHKLLSTGSFKLERTVKSFSTLTEIDIEAEKLENEVKMCEYTNELVIYCAYIGNGLVKIGFTDSNLIKRDKKHMSSESLYPQWRMIRLFKVSGKNIEKMIHEFLKHYKVDFFNQKEIYKPVKNLTIFIENIEDFLKDNDLKMTIRTLQKENSELKLQNMQKENSELKLQNMEKEISELKLQNIQLKLDILREKS